MGWVTPAALPFVVCNNNSFLGSITQSEAWNSLEIHGHVKESASIPNQDSHNAERLATKFAAIQRSRWTEEVDMYSDIIDRIESTLYSSWSSTISIVDTSKLCEFPVDISIADYPDQHLPYALWYFIELKGIWSLRRIMGKCSTILI